MFSHWAPTQSRSFYKLAKQFIIYLSVKKGFTFCINIANSSDLDYYYLAH